MLFPKCKIHKVITTIHGTPPRISQKRSMNKSTFPPKYPEIAPQHKPNTKQNNAVHKPKINEVLKPAKHL